MREREAFIPAPPISYNNTRQVQCLCTEALGITPSTALVEEFIAKVEVEHQRALATNAFCTAIRTALDAGLTVKQLHNAVAVMG